MAYTERVLAGDNTLGPFAIGFNYLAGSTIKVQLLDTLGNQVNQAFTFTGTPSEEQPDGTAVLLNSIAPVGYSIRIYKEVSMTDLVVDWGLGSEFTVENMRNSSIDLMEKAQSAYDLAGKALLDAGTALEATSGVTAELAQAIADITVITDAAIAETEQAVVDAHFWADIASAGAAVANPSGTAEAARDAAIAAKLAAEAARDLAVAAKTNAQAAQAIASAAATTATTAASKAEAYATTAKGTQVETGKYSARHYAETAQDIVNAGALKWNGSSKFVSTQDPNPALGVNGDFWFKREA